MKKKIIIPIAVIIILVLLFVPFYVASFDDGGTRVYGALTYKAVAWKKIYSTIDDNGQPVHGTYQNTSVFWYPDSRKNIDELWKIERDNHLLGAELGAPTPTKCPDSALPTLWMNGKLYKVEPIEEGEAEFDEEDFIGTVESEVGYNKTPVKEMESNILPIGASVYKHRELEDTYVGIYHKNGLVYYYLIFENTKNGEESSVHGTSVFNTKNIKRITFYIDYGLGKGNFGRDDS